jgi:O-antigen ligase
VSLLAVLESFGGRDYTWWNFVLRGQSSEQFLTVTGRADLWRGVFTLFLDQPFLGYGYAASRAALLKIMPWAGHAHNSLAESLLDVGLIGSVFLWCAVGKTLVSSLRRICSERAPVTGRQAAILGILLYFLVLSLSSPVFSGVPGYDVLLFFMIVFVQQRVVVPVRSMQSAPLSRPYGFQSVERRSTNS